MQGIEDLITSADLTLGEAATVTGIAKGTLSKAVAKGKLKATRRPDKSFAIEADELRRYVAAQGHRFRSATPADARSETADLRCRAEVAEAQLAEVRAYVAALERQRDDWQIQAQQALRLALAGPDPVEKPALTWWRRLLGPPVGTIGEVVSAP